MTINKIDNEIRVYFNNIIDFIERQQNNPHAFKAERWSDISTIHDYIKHELTWHIEIMLSYEKHISSYDIKRLVTKCSDLSIVCYCVNYTLSNEKTKFSIILRHKFTNLLTIWQQLHHALVETK